MSYYASPHDTHSPSPTRDHILSIETDNQGQARRILFTDATEAPDRSPFQQRLLVWERDRERQSFLDWHRKLDPASLDSFIHYLPNTDPASWNLGFPYDLTTKFAACRVEDRPYFYDGRDFLARFPETLDVKNYPGPRFVPIVSEGWWSHPFPGRALHPNVPVWRHSPPDIFSPRPYACYVEDCMDPPVYVVFADSEEDAYERAKDWFSVYYPGTRIEESAYADYLSDSISPYSTAGTPTPVKSPRQTYKDLVALGPDNRDEALAYFTENYDGDLDQWGNPVDLESFRMVPLRILSVDFC